jgi:streptogramin lyase
LSSCFGYLTGRRLRSGLALAALLALGNGRFLQAQLFQEFPVPTAGTVPLSITVGPDGNLWFSEFSASNLGRITTAGVVTEFPTSNATVGVTAGPDGKIWFTEQSVNKVGRMATDGVLIGEFSFPPGSLPEAIITGPDGNLWLTEPGTDHIGRLTPSGVLTEFPVPANSGPKVICVGPDGNLWFTEFQGNRIGRITTLGVLTEFPVPTPNSTPVGIAALGNDLWFCETAAAKIGKITTAGVITEFSGPTPNSGPRHIVADTTSARLWFTEFEGNRIGSINPQGQIIEYPVPTSDSGPRVVAFGPDGSAWFTEAFANKIGRIKVTARILTALSPAQVWISLKNGDDVGTIFDLKAEALVGGNKVGEGQLNNVSGFGAGGVFGKALLKAIPLTLSNGPVALPAGTSLAIRVSARISCSGKGHAVGSARLWFNGQAIDSGTTKDAGSRFGATIGDGTANYFLRSGSVLNTAAGSSKLSLDVTVNSAVACSAPRPFTAFGTWSVTP